jgi:hypothetical protein
MFVPTSLQYLRRNKYGVLGNCTEEVKNNQKIDGELFWFINGHLKEGKTPSHVCQQFATNGEEWYYRTFLWSGTHSTYSTSPPGFTPCIPTKQERETIIAFLREHDIPV